MEGFVAAIAAHCAVEPLCGGTLSEDRGETRTDVGMFDVEKIRRIFRCSRPRCTAARWSTSIAGLRRRSLVCVIDTVDYPHRELNANIHRGVHRLAEEATERYEAARDRIRAFIGAAHREGGDLHGGGDGIAQHGGLRMGRYVPAGGRQYRRERDGAPLEPRSVAGGRVAQRGPNCGCCPSTMRDG